MVSAYAKDDPRCNRNLWGKINKTQGQTPSSHLEIGLNIKDSNIKDSGIK